MRKVVPFAVSHPVTVSMATVAAVVFGLVALARLDVRLLPEIRYPSLTIQTEYPNTAPLDVENLVTRPLEEAVGVIPGLRKVHSISQAGLSQVTLEFDWSTDMDFAGLDVREKIDLVTLPEDSRPPLLLKYDPALDPILRIGLWGRAPLVSVRNVAEDVLKKEIESLAGVAAAKVAGGLEEEILVQVDEARLAGLGISILEVNDALARENVNASGGRLRDRNAEYLVRTLSRFEELEEILDVSVAVRGGQPIKLADVAEVHRGHKERSTITHVNGRESVEIAIFKEGDENIVEIANRVRRHLDRIGDQLPEGIELEVLFDQSVFISQAVREVRNNAFLGGVLAILVLYLFLRNFRSTVIIGLSIPISIVATFILMYTRGVSLNVMSLGGLALGVGMLVDNSIVVLESIHRRRTELTEGEGPEGEEKAITRGAGEVAGAVTASTLTTVAVFVPIVFVVEGVSGQIFRDQALTVTFSLLVSLLVALTFTPMFAAIGRRRAERDGSDGRGAEAGTLPGSWKELISDGRGPRWLRGAAPFLFVGVPVAVYRFVARIFRFVGRLAGRAMHPAIWTFEKTFPRTVTAYDRLLRGSLARRGLVLAGVAALTVATGLLLGVLGTELIPPLSQGQLTLALELPEGTPLSRTERAVARIGRELREIDGIELLSANVGLTQEGGGTFARQKESRADVHLRLASASRELEARVLEDVRKVFSNHPEVALKVRRPALLTFNTPVEVDVYGYELGALMSTADRVASEMESVAGLRDVRLAMVPGSPEVRVTFDRDKLNRLGLRLSDVARTVRGKVRGQVASQFRDQEKHIDIRVQNDPDQRNTMSAIRDLIVAERNGIPIRLGSIAGMEIVQGPAEIHRLERKRVAIVSANLAGRDLGSVTEELEGKLRGLVLPANVHAEIGGQNEEMQRSFRSLQMAILLAVFLVYLVMASQFESFLYPFIIMFTVPLALMGAVIGLAVTGTALSVIAAIGGIMLAGIVVNNGIVLVDRINQLRRRRLELHDAVMQAGRERFRPILMTTATTVLGLLPMALGIGDGAELRAPLAITVISGLLLATVLTLVVVPVTYTLLTPGSGALGRSPAGRRARDPRVEAGSAGLGGAGSAGLDGTAPAGRGAGAGG
jgi:HAE1 family hydrophobic/amphiphilic exporter-1